MSKFSAIDIAPTNIDCLVHWNKYISRKTDILRITEHISLGIHFVEFYKKAGHQLVVKKIK